MTVKEAKGAVIGVVGTLDTKGAEVEFLARQVQDRGHSPHIIDVGTRGAPSVKAGTAREDVARAAGSSIEVLAAVASTDAIMAMAQGAAVLLGDLNKTGRLAGVIAVGGGKGTWIASYAMRSLPLGVPKVMVSTAAGRDVRNYVGHTDIVMVPSVADIAGLNRITRPILANAAGAICGMADAYVGRDASASTERVAVALTMFGITTPCGQRVQSLLELRGYEPIVFHANGAGGAALEELIDDGLVEAVIDFTTTELADELMGGICSAGPHRLEAAGRRGLPQVIAPGALDVVNFGRPETIPRKYSGRRLIPHTPAVTLMRTDSVENEQLGSVVAGKLNGATGPVKVLVPTGGFSAYDKQGEPFHDQTADQCFVSALRSLLRADIPLHVLPYHINDPEFAAALVAALDEELARQDGSRGLRTGTD